jgi:hypothetical protein
MVAIALLAVWGPWLLMKLLLWSPTRSLARAWTAIGDLEVVGDILCGPRAYEFLAGAPRPGWICWAYLLALAITVGAFYNLFRHGRTSDRALVLVTGLTVAMVLAVAGTLRIRELSCERYVLYVVPLAAVACTRALGSVCGTRGQSSNQLPVYLTLLAGAVFLGQGWTLYFDPLRHQAYGTSLHPTFWTGQRDPKAAAAELIRQRDDGLTPCAVFAEDWWLQHPLQYLLGSRYSVETRGATSLAENERTQYFVGFTGSAVLERVRARLTEVGLRFQEHDVQAGAGRPIVTVVVIPGRDATEDEAESSRSELMGSQTD